MTIFVKKILMVNGFFSFVYPVAFLIRKSCFYRQNVGFAELEEKISSCLRICTRTGFMCNMFVRVESNCRNASYPCIYYQTINERASWKSNLRKCLFKAVLRVTYRFSQA